jgi:predicted DNA-binding transcriptional regulator AlpA
LLAGTGAAGDRKVFVASTYRKEQNTVAARITPKAISNSLKDFDQLPDSAHVRLPVVEALFACSAATVWRRVKAHEIPRPVKFSSCLTAWNVGQLRKKLAQI